MSVKAFMYSSVNDQLIFLKFEKNNTAQIHLFYSGIVPVTISKELWDHVFTSIQMETKFTLRLC